MGYLIRLFLALVLVSGAWAQSVAGSAETTRVPPLLAEVQDAFFQRLMLEHVLATPALAADVSGAKDQLGALEDRLSARVNELADLVGGDLGRGSVAVLAAMVDDVTARVAPEDAAFVLAAKQVRARIKFERGQVAGLEALDGKLREFVERKRDEKKLQTQVARLAKGMGEYYFKQLLNNGGAMQSVADRVSGQGRVDVNTATVAQLMRVGGIDEALARKIVAARKRAGGFDGLSDLDGVDGIGPAVLQKLGASLVAGDWKRPEKEWCVLSYAAMASNLEGSGIAQTNLMEAVGSGKGMHVVRQLARSKDHETEDRNWVGSRRYYIKKDADREKITSPVIAQLGHVDSGNPQTVKDFVKWALPLFPGRRHWLALENHGGGAMWGYGSDEDHGSHLTVEQLTDAVADATANLRKVTGKADARFDVLSFHACDMSSIEIVHALRPFAKILVVSESIGWGGWAWEGCLSELDKDPKISGEEFARRFVGHLAAWVKDKKRWDNREDMNLALAAFDCDKLEPLFQATGALGAAIAKSLPGQAGAYRTSRDAAAAFEGHRDLDGFCAALIENSDDEGVVAAAKQVRAIYGHPGIASVDTNLSGLAVKFKKPGSVVWGVNGFGGVPPDAMRPAGSRTYLQRNTIVTPLSGPDDKGEYTMTFPRFDVAALQINDIEYQFLGPRGGLGVMRRLSRLGAHNREQITTEFAAGSPLIVEGHTEGFGGCRGLAIQVPLPRDPVDWDRYVRTYRTLPWAKATPWGALTELVGQTMMPDRWKNEGPQQPPAVTGAE